MDRTKRAKPGRKFLVMVPNFWGTGFTINEALVNLNKAGGRFIGPYVIIDAPEGVDVNPIDGYVTWPKGEVAPVVLEQKNATE